MTLEQIFQNVESGIYRLGKKFWKDDPLDELRDEADRLSEELQARNGVAERNSTERDALSRRVADGEINAALLITRIETCVHLGDQVNAWHHALELDHIREALHNDRAQLRQREEIHRRLLFRITQLERQLAGVMEKLYPS